ncbi:hypothetical protein MMC30_005856 [Trapelia coarctata]|nr:hypothetical protein [Trapelia coarctata]
MNREASDLGGPADGQPKLQRGGGSVKRARERVEAGLPPRQEEVTQYSGSSPDNSPITFQRPITPPATKKPVSPSAIGQAISRPSTVPQSPQWPLSSEDDSARRRNNSPTEERTYGKGSAPQRPPRPDYVPSILDTSRLQDQTVAYQYRQPLSPPNPPQQAEYWEQSYQSSPGLTPTIGTSTSGTSLSSSRPSTSSSTATIPDFPAPLQVPQQTRRGANLGPPPSSRRGASSYYSQSSYVTPIPEEAAESIKNGHGSFASSHVMPTNWPDGAPASFLAGEDEDDEDEDGRSSRGTDHDESATLVRSASLGKRHKASLTTIRSPDLTEREGTNRAVNGNNSSKPSLVSRAAVAAGTPGVASVPGLAISRDSESDFEKDDFSTHTAFVAPLTPSDGYVTDVGGSDPHTSKHSPGGTPIDPMVRQILGGLEKGGAINPGTSPPITSPAVSYKSPKSPKRPQRLDLDAAKEAESRGSLTSLPELIRRATRVATNLDRGKTASRLGLFDMLNGSDAKGVKGDRSLSQVSHSGSLTDMLASFPPPGLNTASTNTSRRPLSRWPSPFATNDGLGMQSYSDLKAEVNPQKPGRRCCGIPLWAFVTLMIVLFVLIAAAIIIPVALIVIPRQNAQSGTTMAATCQTSSSCANGGTSIVVGSGCGCVCSNGFSGPSCGQPADAGCTTMNINSNSPNSSYSNATVGSSIPRLLSAAQSNYSIPLNSTLLLSQFSATNLSCSAENALISFNGKTQRRRDDHGAQYDPFQTLKVRDVTIVARIPQATDSVAFPTPASTASGIVVTSDGLLLAGTTTAPSPTATGSGIGSAAAATPTAALTNGQTPITHEDLDFARIVVLFIFQEYSLGAAITAQQGLQGVLIGNTFSPGTVAVGGNVTVDFSQGTVKLQNGTVVGGTWEASAPKLGN